jgi:prepilin-type N-terminal cleavage/methylation domain-containing protein
MIRGRVLMLKKAIAAQLQSAKGFTLVELLVTSAVLGVLVVGSMQYMAYQQRAIRTAEVKGDLVIVRNLIASWIENKSICDATFAGISSTAGGTVQTIFSRRADAVLGTTDQVEFNLGNQIPTTSWRVTNLRLLTLADAQAVSPSITGTAVDGIVTLLLEATLQQVRSSSSNVLVNPNQDRGNYATVEKILHFPMRARVQEMVLLISNPVPNPDIISYYDINPPSCSWGTETTEGAVSTTLGAVLQNQFPNANDANTQWSDPDISEATTLPNDSVTTTHILPCWATTVNVPILECTPAGSGAGID